MYERLASGILQVEWWKGDAAMAQAKTKERKPITREEKLKGREAILAVLARAADDSEFLARLAGNPAEALTEYYTLTQEELAALASGDIKKIEGWLGKLDKRHATWLWCRLSRGSGKEVFLKPV